MVADRRDNGSYIIRRWRSTDGALVPIDGHEDLYDEEEMYRRLNLLRDRRYLRARPSDDCRPGSTLKPTFELSAPDFV